MVTQRLKTVSQLASRAISTKTNVPVLTNMLLTATEDNMLRVESSDLEISIKVAIQVKVDEPGQITVPAKTFTEYIGSIAHDTVVISSDGNQLMVSDGVNDASFVTMPAQDFPELPLYEEQSSQAMIYPSVFRTLVKQTVFAAASGDIHPVLTGVLFVFKNDKTLDVVSTDSYRLSVVTVPFEGTFEGSFIIPASSLRDIDALLADANAIDAFESPITIMVSTTQNQVFVKIGIVEVISRLLDADYPDYQRIFPDEFVARVVVNTASFLEAVKTTSIFAEREGQAVKLTTNPSAQSLDLTAHSSSVGQYKGVAKATITGESFSFGFNARYLLDAIQSFPHEDVCIEIASATKPIVFTSEEDQSYRHVVMPMTIPDES